jgi:hypothetical protein
MPDPSTLAAAESILHVLNDLSPLALAVLLGAIVLLIVHKRGPVQMIKDNHLTHIEAHLSEIAANGKAQIGKLDEIRNDLQWVKGKID